MTNRKSQGLLSFARSVRGRIVFSGMLLLGSAGLLTLSGCSLGMTSGSDEGSPQGGVALHGSVFGGQQPVSGATIQLYEATASGYAAASVPLISATVTSAPDGTFNITGDYTCPGSPNDQVYITATGGNAGSGSNSNLALMAALGPCSGLSGSTFINMNEVTTVASAYALSGFMTDATHVGTSSTNYVGLKNAFASVNNLVNIATGKALTITPFYASGSTAYNTSTVPQSEINTLGNIISSCVNTNGTGGSSPACSNLFTATTPSGGPTPTDTIQAALSMAHNPGHNVSSIFALVPSTPPFSPALSSSPNDWTIAINFIAGGLGGSNANNGSYATNVAVDALGNIWVVEGGNNNLGSITLLNNLGAAQSPSTTGTTVASFGGWKTGSIAYPTGLAIDLSGNAWTSDTNNGQLELTKMTSAGTGTDYVVSGSYNPSSALSIDASGNIWAVIPDGPIAKITSGGSLSNIYTTAIADPAGIGIDGSGNVYVLNYGSNTETELSSTGSELANANPNFLFNSPLPNFAIDHAGNVWLPQNSGAGGVAAMDLMAAGLTSGTAISGGSLEDPDAVAIDGAGHIWIADPSQPSGVPTPPPANLSELTSSGTPITSSKGYTGAGINNTAYGLAVDNSGNVWVLMGNTANSSVTEFVGVGTPVVTPIAAAVHNNTLGTRP